MFNFETLNIRAHRLVESQSEIATVDLCETLEAQALLEELIEANKPAQPATHHSLHFLLSTPFRYPPLKWGSRFGSTSWPSLFYASLNADTMRWEAAYYRLLFYTGMRTPPTGPMRSFHTEFGVNISTPKGVRLEQSAFDELREALRSKTSYAQTHKLGEAMRLAGVQAFTFESARDPGHGLNCALFTPEAFHPRCKKPTFTKAWSCETTAESVVFLDQESRQVFTHQASVLKVDGALPVAN